LFVQACEDNPTNWLRRLEDVREQLDGRQIIEASGTNGVKENPVVQDLAHAEQEQQLTSSTQKEDRPSAQEEERLRSRAGRLGPASTSAFRILFLTNDKSLSDFIGDHLNSVAPDCVEWDVCEVPYRAFEKVKAKYYDLILSVMWRGRSNVGAEFYRRLAELSVSAPFVLVTRFDAGMRELMPFLGDQMRPRFAGFIDVRGNFERQFHDKVIQYISALNSHAVEFENLNLAARLIKDRRSGYSRQGMFPLRTAEQEIEIEIDRLIRRLLVDSLTGARKSGVKVVLSPMASPALGSAITLNATLIVDPGSGLGVSRRKIVLKIGPLPDILDEAASHHESVRFGAGSDQGVELLGVASGDALGGLAYAFSGSLYPQEFYGTRVEHVFISYIREDADQVDRLQHALEAAGLRVWRDTANLWPGQDWRKKIRDAITNDSLVFLACFSHQSLARKKSYQRQELILAMAEMQLRSPDKPWLIPVRFDECEIPDYDIGGGRTIASIQRADLFGDRFGDGAARLIESIRGLLGRQVGLS
jgi:hypothetical protein